MKKKINKIPRSNAIIRYLTNNKDVNAHIRYSSEENDKDLFKDVSGGFDNGIFMENNIVLSERKWIEISGKGIWTSPWLNDTGMFYDAKGNEINEWNLRLWRAENFKLREIGEFSVNYEMDGDLDNPNRRWCDTSTELFIKNEYFETFEDNIYKNGIEFIKNLRLDFGIYVNKKERIKDKTKGGVGYAITSYDFGYNVKKK